MQRLLETLLNHLYLQDDWLSEVEVFICDDSKVLRRIFGESGPGSTDQTKFLSDTDDRSMSDIDGGVVEAGTVDIGTVQAAKLLFDVLLSQIKM